MRAPMRIAMLLAVLCLQSAVTTHRAAHRRPLPEQQQHHHRHHARPRRSPVGRALQAAAATGESEAEAFDRVLQAGVPAGLPSRSMRDRNGPDNATVNILDYGVAADGTKDVSWALDLIGAQFPGGRAVLFPPGIYLIFPYPKLNETVYSVPGHITLSLSDGARLRSNGITRVLIGGTVEADYTQQIFDTPLPQTPVKLSSNGTLARAEISDGFASGHGFLPGDRFFIQGSSPAYDGGWTVTAVDPSNKCAFFFQLLHDPQGGDPGQSATLSIAGFYFVSEAFPGQNLFRSLAGAQEWVSPDWWGAAGSVWDDSTIAVQAAFDSVADVMLMNTYRVSRVSLEGGGRMLEGRGHSLTAMTNARPNPLQLQPVGTLNAVLEIKCLSSSIQNIGVSAAYNGTYTAAVHWYSNDPSIWYVGFNKITNIQVRFPSDYCCTQTVRNTPRLHASLMGRFNLIAAL